MTDEIVEPVEHAAEEVPVPATDPPPEHHEPPAEEHHEKGHDHLCPECIAKVVDAVKESSPINEPMEEVLDKSPVKPPWTHRSPFGHKD